MLAQIERSAKKRRCYLAFRRTRTLPARVHNASSNLVTSRSVRPHRCKMASAPASPASGGWCPEFRPTRAEFSSFVKYIRTVVEPQCAGIGMCKVSDIVQQGNAVAVGY